MTPPTAIFLGRKEPIVLLLWLGALCLVAGAALRADPAKCAFDVPAGDAGDTLKQFSEQCGCSLIVATDLTAGVRTQPVQGKFTPLEALSLMLRGTGLAADEDSKSGAFTVRRRKDAGPAPDGEKVGAQR